MGALTVLLNLISVNWNIDHQQFVYKCVIIRCMITVAQAKFCVTLINFMFPEGIVSI